MFYFQEETNRHLIDDFNKGINLERKDYKQLFGDVHQGHFKVKVVFYQNSKDLGDDVSGAYDLQRHRISINAFRRSHQDVNQYNQNIEVVSAHEYNHYLLQQFLNQHNIQEDKVPAWLEEGMARYTENRSDGTDFSEQSLQGYQLIPFEKLNNEEDWKRKINKQSYNIYSQSGLFVAYLLQKNGKETVHNLLLKLKEEPFDLAFKEITGQEFKSYEAEYFADIQTSLSLWKKVDQSLKERKPEQAIKFLGRIHSRCPQSSYTLYWEARQYMAEGNKAKANELVKLAKTLNPRDPEYDEFFSTSLSKSN